MQKSENLTHNRTHKCQEKETVTKEPQNPGSLILLGQRFTSPNRPLGWHSFKRLLDHKGEADFSLG